MINSADSSRSHLIRGIGVFGGALLVLNGMIGSGIFALPSVVAAKAGIWSPWPFLATSVLFMTVVLAFAELSSYFRESGGPVLYATTVFGPLVGFSTGWIYYISQTVALAANSHVMATYVGALWPWFGTSVGRLAVIVSVIGGLTVVNVLGVRSSIRTLTYFTVLKVVPLVVMIILGLQYFSPELVVPSSLPGIDDFGGTVLLLLYAFIGFETVLITAGETEKPRSTIPKTLMVTVIATGTLYFLIMLVYNLVLPGVANPDATLIEVGRVLAGPVGVFAITLTAIFSIGGSLSSMMLAGPRLTFALAEHDLLPNWFKRVARAIFITGKFRDVSWWHGIADCHVRLIRPTGHRHFTFTPHFLHCLHCGITCYPAQGGRRSDCACVSGKRWLHDSCRRICLMLMGSCAIISGFMVDSRWLACSWTHPVFPDTTTQQETGYCMNLSINIISFRNQPQRMRKYSFRTSLQTAICL